MTSTGDVTRRTFTTGALTFLASPALTQTRAKGFSKYTVIDLAQQLAAEAFDASVDKEPPQLAQLSYDDYRNIRMRPEARISLGQKFSLDLFHRGHLFAHKVTVHLLHEGQIREILYQSRMFDFGGLHLGPLDRSIGFAGLRLRYPLNRPDVADKLSVFLGASYFRFLGRGQRYGQSARALGINAGLPGITEEFPFFRSFWIEEAADETSSLIIHALLDSPSVTGAYRFEFFPGEETVVDVQSSLFPRVTLEQPAIAPITSMFLTGSQDRRMADDFRPEVHDTDGLHIVADGKKVWLPLRNPTQSTVTHHAVTDLQKFSLLQRHRSFDDYQDLEANYEKRPGYSIEPVGDWGRGALILSELVTNTEIHDNIVVSFCPEKPLLAGERREYNYRLSTITHETSTLAITHRILTHDTDTGRLIIADFTGGDLSYWREALSDVTLNLHSDGVNARSLDLNWNTHLNGIRARLFAAGPFAPEAKINVTLLARGQPLSETLSLRLTSHAPPQELAEGRGVR